MSLTRVGKAGVGVWEVDGSGMVVCRSRPEVWQVESYPGAVTPEHENHFREYMHRHGLLDQTFSSRARAVDAIRLALREEPSRPLQIRTAWRKTGPGEYHSTDGHWRLTRTPKWDSLDPVSQSAREAVEANPPIGYGLSWVSGHTLRASARVAEQISNQLGLPVSSRERNVSLRRLSPSAARPVGGG